MTIEELEAQIKALESQLLAIESPQSQTTAGHIPIQGSVPLSYVTLPKPIENDQKLPVPESKNKIADDFSPIEHEDVEKLDASLEKAIQFSAGGNSEKLAAVLILANHVEYLSKDVLVRLRRMVRISAQYSYGGTIFWPANETKNVKDKKIDKLMSGEIIGELKQFNFPDKDDFLKYLKEFNERRIPLIHDLLKKDPTQDLQIHEILNIFYNIFKRYKIITKEINSKWLTK